MNERKLREMTTRFAAELETSPALRARAEDAARRARRARELLVPARVPTLGEDEIREIFFDSAAFGFWVNKEWEFNQRLRAVGLDGLRRALLELATRAELGMTYDDLRAVWQMRGLGRLLATELLAYRFPERYWTYSPSVTLQALAALGDDVKDTLPRGRRSDPHLYLALEPRMLRIRTALAAAGVEPADNLAADSFLWWVKRTLPSVPTANEQSDPTSARPMESVIQDNIRSEFVIQDNGQGVMGRAAPTANSDTIARALEDFDRELRHQPRWIEWERSAAREYAIHWRGRRYPVREIVRMATGHAVLDAASTRTHARCRGFDLARRDEPAENAEPARPTLLPSLLSRAMAGAGLHFTSWQVATFFTALQVKGFVILSGISGTGKTRLAQRLAEVLPQPSLGASAELPADAVAVTVQPYMLKYGRLIVPRQATRLFDPPVADDARDLVVSFAGRSQTCQFVRATYGGRDYLSLTLRGELRAWFNANLAEGDVVVLEPEFDHDDALVGLRISAHADWPAAAEGARNWLFVPVRPDWRDSRGLLGYFNPLTRTYEWTPFLRFLLRAARAYRAGSPLAWFVILDEMNLAHVEHYFADLLSVLESGRDELGFTREALTFAYPDDAEGDLPPRELRLPPSLYIVGTVNVDETTHAFSPKVLDRAFTIELTEADFASYPPPEGAATAMPDERERAALLAALTQKGRFARVDKDRVAAYVARSPETRERLARLAALLRPHDLHFGYRVFDEIVAFMAAAEEGACFGDARDEPLDAAVLTKVLPKFHGSRARLEAPLRAVLAWCADPDAPALDAVDNALRSAVDGNDATASLEALVYRCPRSAERARRMLRRLYADGFAAFGY